MPRFIYIQNQSPPPSPPVQKGSGTALLLLTIALAAIFALIGTPNTEGHDFTPPPGIATYQMDNMTCWDKKTCCDPSDESTCASFPMCTMNQ